MRDDRPPLKAQQLFVRRGDQELFVDIRGRGPTLVFAHGLNGTHADGSWLSGPAAGFTLVAPDLRGRGRSSPARSVEEHSYGNHADDLAAILDQLDFKEAVVAGTSFGAAVAIAFAQRYQARVRALILLASAFGAKLDPMGEGNLAAYGELAERIANQGLDSVAKSEAERTGSNRPKESDRSYPGRPRQRCDPHSGAQRVLRRSTTKRDIGGRLRLTGRRGCEFPRKLSLGECGRR